MKKIFVNNKQYYVNKSENILTACLSLGVDIPYFCWHPALGSVGSCRQCAVKVYSNKKDKIGKLVMSCMTPISDQMLIFVNDSESVNFRKIIIELLMINHPHDCPVCDEGGNCHLQDMTVMNQHYSRRYSFKKKTHSNQYLGPFIKHNMNRCISCYRCVRYYKDYSDGKDFGVYGSNNNLYFGRINDGCLESEHSGNLIEICPTGVFTDKIASNNYARKWDMQYAPSICQHCSVGCNILAGERYGKLVKVENRYHAEINHYFICDRGRFSHGYSNLIDKPNKITKKLKNKNFRLQLNIEEAIDECKKLLLNSSKIIGVGSSRASIENNYALFNLVGEKNFFVDCNTIENSCIQLIISVLKNSGAHVPTLKEIESYDCVLVLGEDVSKTSPRVALAIRQAIKNFSFKNNKDLNLIEDWNSLGIFYARNEIKNPLYITNTDFTSLDDTSSWSYIASINDQVRLAFSIAHEINSNSPEVIINDYILYKKIQLIVQSFLQAKKVLIVSGSNTGSIDLIKSSSNIVQALISKGKKVGIVFLTSNVNSIGLGLIGQKSVDLGLENILSGKSSDTLIVLENDLYRFSEAKKINFILENFNSIVIDHQNTETFKKASISLPCTNFFESSGTVINYEIRAQRFFQVYDPNFYNKNSCVLDSWKWIQILDNNIKNKTTKWFSVDDVINSCIMSIPNLIKIKEAAPNANFRISGQKIARSPNRYSGRTALFSNKNVHEPAQPTDHNTMFSFSMEGNNQFLESSSQIPFPWFPGWNSLQSWNKYQDKISGNFKNGNPGIRIIDDLKSSRINFFYDIPKDVICQDGFMVVPYYSLLDYEELSQRSRMFLERKISEKIAILSIFDGNNLNLVEGDTIQFNCSQSRFLFIVNFSKFLARGQIGLPIGKFGVPYFLLGQKVINLRKKDKI